MKLLILGFLLLLSLQARSNESVCASLFTDYPYPVTLPIERVLFTESREVFKLVNAEKVNGFLTIKSPKVDFLFVESNSSKKDLSQEQRRLLESLTVMHNMYGLSNYIKNKKITSDLKSNMELRLDGTLIGVLLRISETLRAMNINHTLDYNHGLPFISIRTDGNHYLNKTLKRLKKEYNLVIKFDVFELINSNAGGIFINSSSTAPIIVLHPNILLEKSMFQNSNALHEYTHLIDDIESQKKINRPYNGGAWKKIKGPNAKVYDNSFNIDEIQAYRTSIRVYAHEALVAKTENDFEYWYNRIITSLEYEIKFSKIVKEGLENPKEALYEILGDAENSATYKMASFTLKLYSAIQQRIKDVENETIDDKKLLLKKIIKLLTNPKVKKLDGDYPSSDYIAETLK